jgi:aspartate racemase
VIFVSFLPLSTIVATLAANGTISKAGEMKTIGLLGGMSWHSTVRYYRLINEAVENELGGHHSARIVMISVDFAEIEALQRSGKWDRLGEVLTVAAQAVQQGGAGFLVICSNTAHKLTDRIQAGVTIPLLHIADTTAEAVLGQGLNKVGLLGTKITMEEDFFRGRLTDKHGLEVILPDAGDREVVDRIIFKELCHNEIRDSSKARLLGIIDRLADAGAQGIVLGCTEIGLLVREADCRSPVFDTTEIHAAAAVRRSLSA